MIINFYIVMKKIQTKCPKNIHIILLFTIAISLHQIALANDYLSNITINSIDYIEYKGKVIDFNTKKPLALATLVIEKTNISTITNSEGDFILKVPKESINKTIVVSFLGYESKVIPINNLKEKNNIIVLISSIIKLEEVNIKVLRDAKSLVKEIFDKREENYLNTPTIMTAFYRETIKKKHKNVSLSEAIVKIYKSSYTSIRDDDVELFKSRKSTNYKKLDTIALKLQGGPFNTLLMDIMKYPEYIFSEDKIEDYIYTYDYSTTINNRIVSIISFKQKENKKEALYKGHLFIDAKNKVLISANYALDVTDKEHASKIFIKKKPTKASVWPKKINYRVDYIEKDGKWYHSYSNAFLEFKVNWTNKLFNSTYSMVAEMAVTDWKNNLNEVKLKPKDKLKKAIILTDKIAGFNDTEFWGKYNIIEPEKSIESAIKKIKKQLEKSKAKN